MRQYKDSRYWVSEVGEVSRYFKLKKRNIHSTYKGKTYHYEYDIPETWKPRKPSQSNGYYILGLSLNGGVKMKYIHRLVAEIYVPGYFEGAHVDHIDCNILNNHYTNLQWCTKEYNSTKGNDTTFPLYIEWNK